MRLVSCRAPRPDMLLVGRVEGDEPSAETLLDLPGCLDLNMHFLRRGESCSLGDTLATSTL